MEASDIEEELRSSESGYMLVASEMACFCLRSVRLHILGSQNDVSMFFRITCF